MYAKLIFWLFWGVVQQAVNPALNHFHFTVVLAKGE